MSEHIAGKTFSTPEEAGVKRLSPAEVDEMNEKLNDGHRRYQETPPEVRHQAAPKFWDDTSGTEFEGLPENGISRDAARRYAQTALDLTRNRLATVNSTYGVYQHAEEQLLQILQLLQSEQLPEESARSFVDIGLMAVKELDGNDDELGDALMKADYAFKHAH